MEQQESSKLRWCKTPYVGSSPTGQSPVINNGMASQEVAILAKSETPTHSHSFLFICGRYRSLYVRLKKLDGLKRYNTNGYYQYYIPEHHLANKAGLVYEHQIMAEAKLRRELKPEEVVHHNDRDRHNNSFDNLIVFKTIADHTAYHAGRDIVLDGDVYVTVDSNDKTAVKMNVPIVED